MTAGILVNKGRGLSGGERDMPDAYCGGCQRQLKMGHGAGCPAIAQEIVLSMAQEGESVCYDCGRPERLGHAQDCSEVIGRFGLQMGGW